MKTILLISCILLATVFANAQSRWSYGIETGCMTNISKFTSGDEIANALFKNEPYHSAAVAVNFRYRINKMLSFQSGFYFTEFGFQYSMARDYSLLQPDKQYTSVRTSTCISSVPSLLIVNTPMNCNKIRFIFGAGYTIAGLDNEWISESSSELPTEELGNAKTSYMTEQSQSSTTMTSSITWMIGVEKVFKRGNMLDFVFRGNQGLTDIAVSTVNYTAANKDYTHSFTNKGSYVSLAIAYYFKPIGSKKANKLQPSKAAIQ